MSALPGRSSRRFDPVHLPDGAWPERGISVTLAGRFNACPRSAYLALLHDGGPRSHPMLTGSAGHRILELATEAMIEQGEPFIPPEIVKAIANEVFADPAYGCPVEEQDRVREAVYRWGATTALDPSTVVACERLFELDIAGIVLRGKIDLALLLDEGARVEVRDYKFSRALPSMESLGRKRPDGTIAARSLQLVCYALLVAYGVPVRVEPCSCGGPPYPDTDGPDGERWPTACGICNGTGRIETREPFGLAARAQTFDLSYVFPALEERDGKLRSRDVSLTRLELTEYRASVEALLSRMVAARDSGDWPAVPDPEGHCKECVARPLCPIPAVLRTHAGEINTVEQAREAALRAEWDRAELRARDKEIKAFVKAQPEQRLRFGPNFVLEPGYQAAEKIRDKDGLWVAVDRAVQYGEPFDQADWVQTVESTPLRVRKLSEDELADEACEEEAVPDADGDLDARFGETAPW